MLPLCEASDVSFGKLNTAGFAMMTVELLAFAVAEPPPDTLTGSPWRSRTGPHIHSYGDRWVAGPSLNASLRVQLLAVHVHPVPAIDTSVSPKAQFLLP